jgi:proteasome lid subunit RPN8/RPN11
MRIKPMEEVIPQQLDITFSAFKKAIIYARLVAQERGGSECIGYLLSDRENAALLVDDVLLAPHQRATPSSVQIEGSAVLAAGREIQARGKRAIGWWHSHNNMAAFHSCIDDENTEKLLHELAPANLHYAHAPLPLRLHPSEEGLQLQSAAGVLGVLQTDSSLIPSQATFQRIIPVGVVFSLVVNVRGQTYVEVASKQWCGFCQREEVKTQRIPLRLVEQEDEPPLDAVALRAEVRRKVWTPVTDWNWKRLSQSSQPHWQVQDEQRWQRLVHDADAGNAETPTHLADEERIDADGASNGRDPLAAHPDAAPSETDPSHTVLPSCVVLMLEQVLTEVREIKSLLTNGAS